MKQRLGILFGVVLCGLTCHAQKARFTVRVVDEGGAVVSNAEVHVGVPVPIQPGSGWGSGAEREWRGHTDTNGLCAMEVKCYGEAGVAVLKEAYYPSSGYSIYFTDLVAEKWQPWNPTTEVILKQIGTPIPMYARKMKDVKVPVEGKPVGFDLMKGDWVAPHGNGEVADFLFTLTRLPERTVTNQYGPTTLYDVTLNVDFPNDGDGIQSIVVPLRQGGSNLRLPREAPIDGYEPVMSKRIYQDETNPPYSDILEDQSYFFRVRTVMDEAENMVSALYGKIHGDIELDWHGKIRSFVYYLNPTPNDRNLEFDPKRNLFKNLESLEQVSEP